MKDNPVSSNSKEDSNVPHTSTSLRNGWYVCYSWLVWVQKHEVF